MRALPSALIICLLAPTVVLAEDNPNPLSTYGAVENILLHSAEKMPKDNYNFRSTDALRSYGQIVGHLNDAPYMSCSIELGEKNPDLKIEQTKSSKVDLINALKGAFAYCDKAYESVTDASAPQMVKLFGNDMPKLGVLTANNMRDLEHYGNLITYMRLKNVVPPTSEPGFRPMPQPRR
jgi:hypothetical protein